MTAETSRAADPDFTLMLAPVSEREAMVTHVFDAPRRLVFDAWAKPEHVPNWMLGPEGWTMPVCEIDLRPSGAWLFVWRRANGTELEMTGGVPRSCAAGAAGHYGKLGRPLARDGQHARPDRRRRTTAVLTITYASGEARDAALSTGTTEGLTQSYNRLAEYVRTMV